MGAPSRLPGFEIHLRLFSSVYPNTRPELDKVWLMIFTSESNLPPVEIGLAKIRIRDWKVGVSDAFVQSGGVRRSSLNWADRGWQSTTPSRNGYEAMSRWLLCAWEAFFCLWNPQTLPSAQRDQFLSEIRVRRCMAISNR